MNSSVCRSLIGVAAIACLASPTFAKESKWNTKPLVEGRDFAPVLLPSQIERTLFRPPAHEDKPLATSRGVPRDPKVVRVYERVAPAVVFLTDGRTGHGTGVFIRPDGWLLTNHHVADFMPYDGEKGVLSARVVLGELGNDGAMEPVDEYVEARVYRADAVRDLALLKLNELPAGKKNVPHIELAERSPPPGSSCFAIGHPSVGVLWTFRAGEVAGRGQFPRDQLVPGRLIRASDPDVGREVEAFIAQQPSRKVLLSTCGVNPGDSGGPLTDEEGQLIALTFAMPKIDLEEGVDLGNFFFHVHLDEVQAFLENWPRKPEVQPPSELPAADGQGLADTNKDGVDDTWIFHLESQQAVTGVLADLDQDSRMDEGSEGEAKDSINKISTRDPMTEWDYEFAATLYPRTAFFFDRDNNGEIDLVHIDQAEAGVVRLVLDGKTWAPEKYSGAAIPVDVFDDKALNKQLERFVQRFTQ